MPIDPTISLAAGAPLRQQGNPLGADVGVLGQWMGVQNAINQNLLFQQTFHARQEAGETIANTPGGLDEKMNALLANPRVAAYAGPIINELKQAQLAMIQGAGEQQKQYNSAMEGFFKYVVPTSMANPQMFGSALNSWIQQLGTMSPVAAQRAAVAADSIRRGWADGLEGMDPAQAQQAFRSRGWGMLTSVLPPGQAYATLGGMEPRVVEGAGPGGKPAVVGGLPFGAGAGASSGPSGGGPIPGAGAGGAITAAPTTEEKSAYEGYGKVASEIAQDMAQRQESLPNNIRRMDLMQQALTQAQAGGWAHFRENLGRALQGAQNAGLPVPQATIDRIANSSLQGSQLFNAEVKPLLLAQLKEVAAGRFLKSEVEGYFNSMDLSSDPNVLMHLLNQANYTLKVGYDQAQKFPEFKKLMAKKDPSVAGMDIPDYFAWYNGQKGLGGRMEPIPEGTLKGTGAPERREGAAPPLPVPENALAPPARPTLDQLWQRVQ